MICTGVLVKLITFIVLSKSISARRLLLLSGSANSTSVSIKPFARGGAWTASTPTTFNNAWIAAYLSQTVYNQNLETDKEFKKRFKKDMTVINGAKNCTWFSGTEGGQNVGLIETIDSFIFVFRGSKSQKDFITDAYSQAPEVVPFSDSKAVFGGTGPSLPDGFFEPFKSLWNSFLVKEVNTIKARIANGTGPSFIYITGHSLGAVNAQYMAAATQNAGLNVTGVFPFASPNTGGHDIWLYGDGGHSWNVRYKDLGLDKKTWLFNNPKDIVPSLPAGGWNQVNAAATFNPVNQDPSLCPFGNNKRIARTRSGTTRGIKSLFGDLVGGQIDSVKWEHNIGRYVWQLGKTCANTTDPLWAYVWSSHIIPVKGA